jgi:hypothetical protein
MGNFEIGNFIAAIIILTIAVLSGTMVYNGIVKQNNVLTNYSATGINTNFINETEYEEFSKAFDKQAQLEADIGELRQKVNGTTPGDETGFLGSINSMLKTAFSGVKFMLGSFTVMNSMFDAIPNYLKLGPEGKWLSTLLKLLVICLILFAIYKLIFRSPTV